MKIKVTEKSYEEVMAMPPYAYEKPRVQGRFWRWLLKTVSAGELKKVHFRCEKEGMERLPAEQPALILMNHSSFIDLKIASTVLYPRQFHIICTADGFVGKAGLMRAIGCIPTKKFVSDLTMIKDMVYALQELKSDVLMFPEASYTFDGTATPLPESLGKALKILKVPVVMIRTYGAFTRDPLYNGLQLRQVDVTAKMTYLLSPEEIAQKTPAQLNAILKDAFTFDNWAWQQDNHIRVAEPFRADGLHRVLYKCPCCEAEGAMEGKGIHLICHACGSKWELDEFGRLERIGADQHRYDFSQVPSWYAWEREQVRKELEQGSYRMDLPVDIIIMTDFKSVYRVGEGRLVHDNTGIHLTGCDGKLEFSLTPAQTYSLYADYFWYEIGDMISIGDTTRQYYCFPKSDSAGKHDDGQDDSGSGQTGEAGQQAIVAKARLAAEELYKMNRPARRRN